MRVVEGHDVVALLEGAEAHGIETFVEGGWGVDALVGRRLRPHKDVDVVINATDVDAFVDLLTRRGFVIVAGEPPHGFVAKDATGSSVDVRSVTFDDHGRAFAHDDTGGEIVYPSGAFDGQGVIAGRAIRCLSAEAQMMSHQGYAFGEKDVADVWALHDFCGIDLAQDYAATTRPYA